MIQLTDLQTGMLSDGGSGEVIDTRNGCPVLIRCRAGMTKDTPDEVTNQRVGHLVTIYSSDLPKGKRK